MVENQNGMTATAPKLQKRLAAAKTNRRRRHIGHALIFIASLLMVVGGTVGGLAGELVLIAGVAALSAGGFFLAKEVTHG